MWEIRSSAQLRGFFCAAVVGMILCVAYDLIRGFRFPGRTGRFSIAVGDTLYGLCAGIVTFCLLLACTNGEPRGYIFIGEIVGFLGFRLTVSSVLFPVFRKIILKIAHIFDLIKGKYRGFLCQVAHVLRVCLLYFERNSKNIYIFLKKLLKNSRNVLYTMVNSSFYRKGGSDSEKITQQE